jgi:hypothetical protein
LVGVGSQWATLYNVGEDLFGFLLATPDWFDTHIDGSVRKLLIEEVELEIFDFSLPVAIPMTIASDVSSVSLSFPGVNYTTSWSGGATQVGSTALALTGTVAASASTGVYFPIANSTITYTGGLLTSNMQLDASSELLTVLAGVVNNPVTLDVTTSPIVATQTTPSANLSWVTGSVGLGFSCGSSGYVDSSSYSGGGVVSGAPMPFSGTVNTTATLSTNAAMRQVGWCLYVAESSNPSGKVSMIDPLKGGDMCRDVLDLVVDVYSDASVASGHVSRRWKLKLPCPIIIGPDQSLMLNGHMPNQLNPIVVFFRVMATPVN